MTIGSLSTPLAGIRAGLDGIDRTARRIAQGDLDRVGHSMADLSVNQRRVEANIAALKTSDDVTGHLLDILA